MANSFRLVKTLLQGSPYKDSVLWKDDEESTLSMRLQRVSAKSNKTQNRKGSGIRKAKEPIKAFFVGFFQFIGDLRDWREL